MMRRLVVVADDFGIGPETSRGILDLAERRRLSATVLLVTSPYAREAVRAWQRCRAPLELGWHPCLTLDRPLLPAARVASLVDAAGRFHTLPRFLARLLCGAINQDEAAAELRAQYQRFGDLVGAPPACVNFHHHLHCFPALGRLLTPLLQRQRPLPYLRRVREPWRAWLSVSGRRGPRLALALLGRWASAAAFPGNDWIAQPDEPLAALRCTPGAVVELVCHPGHPDATLAGRDPMQAARAQEWRLLAGGRFLQAVQQGGFALTTPAAVARRAADAA